MLKYIKVFFLLMAAFLVFATLSWLLPDIPIRKHIDKTLQRSDLFLLYPEALAPEQQCRQDNFTDALILNQCYCNDRHDWIQSVLLLPSAYPKDSKFPNDGLLYLSNGGKMEQAPLYFYPRYWHGSTFLMRFLLLLAPYSNLRFFLLAISLFLMMLLCARLYLLRGWMPVAVLAVTAALMRIPIIQCSIQFFPVLFIALLTALLLCNSHERWRTPSQATFLLFVAGALTAYFDLLTTPVLTLGLPLCILLLLRRDEAVSLALELWLMVRASLLWAVGYGATWVSKWILGTLLTPMNVWKDGIGQFLYRSSDTADYTRWEAMLANTDLIDWPWWLTMLIVLGVLLTLQRLRKKRLSTPLPSSQSEAQQAPSSLSPSSSRIALRTAIPLLLVALFPLAWYLVVSNHSFIHNWFTFRLLWILLIAIPFALLQFFPNAFHPSGGFVKSSQS